MNKMVQGAFVGDLITDAPVEKPKSRQERVDDWRKAHEAEYRAACKDAECTCTPTRAQAFLMEQYQRPPID